MRYELNRFYVLDFQTRKKAPLEDVVAILNTSFNLLLETRARIEKVFAEEVSIARNSADKKALHQIDQRIKLMVNSEAKERMVLEIVKDHFYFDIDRCMVILEYARSVIAGVHAPNFDHFVIVGNTIRIFGAKN